MSRSAINRIRCGLGIDFAEAIVVRFEASSQRNASSLASPGVARRAAE
jgi:hypothetical protein